MRFNKSSRVQTHNLHPQLVIALDKAERIFDQRYYLGDIIVSYGLVITSGHEGKSGDKVHSEKSLHYIPNKVSPVAGCAVDIRCNHIMANLHRKQIFYQLKDELDSGFDVIDEGDHFHIEYDPEPLHV